MRYEYSDSMECSRRKLEYDLDYLKNMPIFFDLAIIFKTARIDVSGSGRRQ